MKKAVAAILIAASAQWASADGLKSLENFMKTAHSGRADFTQTVTAPPKDGQAQPPKQSSGSFEFQRPGRFKFVYKKPFEQTIVAQEVEKALKPVHAQLDDLQATVDAMAEAEGIEPEKTRKGKKHRR